MAEKERKPEYNPDYKMVVSNNYVRAIHPDRMGINGMKLFRLVVTQCRMEDEQFFLYRFKVKEIANMFGVKDTDIYRDIQTLCKNLAQTVLYVGDGNPKHSWEYRPIFSKCRHDAGKGTITVKLSPDVTDLFLQLKRNFTQIPIANILSMRSGRSIRVYELICEKMRGNYPYADVAVSVNVTVEELKKITQTETSEYYTSYFRFKEKIVTPAFNEIERCAGWKIIVHNIREERRITGYTLEVWSANGYEYIQKCKANGIIPNYGNREQVRGQMSLDDFPEYLSK